jgi:hypothetical protein
MSTLINVGKIASKKILERKHEMRKTLLRIGNMPSSTEREKLLNWVRQYPEEEKEISDILQAEKQAESDRKDEDIRSAKRSIQEEENSTQIKKTILILYKKGFQKLHEERSLELVENTCVKEYKCRPHPPMFPKMKCIEDGCNNIANYAKEELGNYWKCYNHCTILDLMYTPDRSLSEIHHTDFVTSRKRMAANGRMKTFLMGTSPTINEKPNESAIYTGMVSNYCYEPKLFGIIKDFL